MMLFNSRSIANKVVFLDALINSESLDFIFIVETWLKPIYTDSYVLGTNNYSILRKDRAKVKGGGVCVIYKNELASKIIPVEIHEDLCDGFEIMAFDFYPTTFNYSRFVCVYLPPLSANSLTTVKKLTRIITSLKTNSNLFILGDFNLPKYRSYISGNAGMPQEEFKNFLAIHNLSQLISFPTHVQGNTLEFFITSNPKTVVNLEQREPLAATCDHNMIKIRLDLKHLRKPALPKRRNFYKGQYNQINAFLSKYNWKGIFSGNNTDINFVYSKFINVIHRSIEKYVPFYKSFKKPSVPKSIKTLLTLKKAVYKLSKTDSSSKPVYKDLEKVYKQAIYKNNISIQQQVSSCSNKKSFFWLCKQKTSFKKEPTPFKR